MTRWTILKKAEELWIQWTVLVTPDNTYYIIIYIYILYRCTSNVFLINYSSSFNSRAYNYDNNFKYRATEDTPFLIDPPPSQ